MHENSIGLKFEVADELNWTIQLAVHDELKLKRITEKERHFSATNELNLFID